jgi:hypothetical protein
VVDELTRAVLPGGTRGHEMSLWDVLTLASGGAAIGGAPSAAKSHAINGDPNYLIALVVGIVSAIASIAAVRALGTRILGGAGTHWRQEPSTAAFYSMYLAAMIWILIAGAIGGRVAAFVLTAAA